MPPSALLIRAGLSQNKEASTDGCIQGLARQDTGICELLVHALLCLL